jgi:hypothetical protein
MKRKVHLLFFMLAVIASKAQVKTAEKSSNPGFIKAVEIVLGDFPYNYHHITGDLLLMQGEVEQYASTVSIPGAQSCIIGRYHSELDTTASWQAVLYSNEEFENAATQYKQLFHQLKGCHLRMSDGSVYYLDGKYEDATEAMPFVSSSLAIQTADERFKNFKVEIELLYQVDKWVININMVTKKKDDEIRPEIVSGN